MTLYVTYQQATTYSAAIDRKLQQAEMVLTSRSGIARGGILPQVDDNTMKVSSQSGMMVLINMGVAIVAPDYRILADANASLTLDAGGASARTDLVVLRVYDTESGDSSSKAQFEIVKGTTSADPTVPPRSIVLAAIAVAASAASITQVNITDRRTNAATQGGVLVGDATTVAQTGFSTGQLIYDQNADRLYTKTAAGPSVPVMTPRSVFSIIPSAGYTAHASYPTKARLEGGRCFLEGYIIPTSGNLVTGAVIMALPAPYRPAVMTAQIFMCYAGVASGWCRVRMFPNGNCVIDSFSTAVLPGVYIDPINYPTE